jgi:uncharacterized membrane protein YgdD (TMEM256/DUF423 family)
MTESENRRHDAMSGAARGSWIAFAALSGGLSVIAGAFAAHGLNAETQAAEIGWLHTGSLYEALHALAILAVAALAGLRRLKEVWALWSQRMFAAGSILFPGALYGLALHMPRWLGAVAPLGGTAFILGWLALAAAALGQHEEKGEHDGHHTAA